MKPTLEQLELIALAVAKAQGSAEPSGVIDEDRDVAMAAWEAIVPMLLPGATAREE